MFIDILISFVIVFLLVFAYDYFSEGDEVNSKDTAEEITKEELGSKYTKKQLVESDYKYDYYLIRLDASTSKWFKVKKSV